MSVIAFLAFAWNLWQWAEYSNEFSYKIEGRANGWWAFFWFVIMIVSY